MESATIRDVQHNLAAYLKRVEQGEDIVIRRRNIIVARLVPAQDSVCVPKDLEWSKVRERRAVRWAGKRVPGKSGTAIVRESRGER